MRKTKVLITGGAGFIGYHLAQCLIAKEGYQIDIADRLSRGKRDADFIKLLKNKNIKFINVDLLNKNSYAKFSKNYDYIYHLCAIVGVRNVISQPEEVLKVNIIGTLFLLDWIKRTQRKLRKIIFASTSEVYAGTLRHYGGEIPTAEDINICLDDIHSLRSTYAVSKIAGESACLAYHSAHKIPIVILRYHNVYGPRMGYDHVIPELFNKAGKCRGVVGVHSIGHSRAFCYISDAVEVTIRLAESPKTAGELYHIGNDLEEVTVGLLAQKIIKIVNPLLRIKTLPDHQGSPVRRRPDIKKVRLIVGFEPSISLDEGLIRTWNWYREH